MNVFFRSEELQYMSIVAANIENLKLQMKSRGFNFSNMGKKMPNSLEILARSNVNHANKAI